MMFRDWTNIPPIYKKPQWKLSPSRCAWVYLDHMLSYVRSATSGDPAGVAPGGLIPYSRDEVSITLARRVMVRERTTVNIRQKPIVWRTAMGHQCGRQLEAIEVRINLDRPTGGTHDAVIPRSLRGSPEIPILQERKDSFHTLMLSINGRYIMNILILRIMVLVATKDYLLNGVMVPVVHLIGKVAEFQISEDCCLHFLYDSLKSCLEAVKNCYRKQHVKEFFADSDMVGFVQDLGEKPKGTQPKANWSAIIGHFKMDIMQQAADLIYRPKPNDAIVDRVRALTDTHGSFCLYGIGDNAALLDSTIVDEEGHYREQYMLGACSLVLENGLVTRLFMNALVYERSKFCTNRINHIEAVSSSTGSERPSETVTLANEKLGRDTFGSKMYKAKHDLQKKGRN